MEWYISWISVLNILEYLNIKNGKKNSNFAELETRHWSNLYQFGNADSTLWKTKNLLFFYFFINLLLLFYLLFLVSLKKCN